VARACRQLAAISFVGQNPMNLRFRGNDGIEELGVT
jgi:hypothetical protein